jgi:hypothetical protein
VTYEPVPDKTITLSPEAADTVAAMHSRVAQIADLFGQDSPEAYAAAQSLARVLANLLVRGLGGAHVSRDGALSLFVREAGFCYGIIFFRDHGAAERHLRRHGHTPETSPDWDDLLAHHADIAGTWSTHS